MSKKQSAGSTQSAKTAAVVAVIVGTPFACLIGLVLLVVSISGATTEGSTLATAAALTLNDSTVCATTGTLPGLDDTQAHNARVDAATATSLGGYRASVSALMVAITESGLLNLGNPNVEGATSSQGSGTNYDSVGQYQQRNSYGTAAQRLDPVWATAQYVQRVMDVASWDSDQPWIAAQSVQVSAFDGRPRVENGYSSVLGSNYEGNYQQAVTLSDKIAKDAAQQPTCGTSSGIPANPDPASHGLPRDYEFPATATDAERTALTYALARLGYPYIWAAAGPNAYDCSGLTMQAWAQAGIALPHLAASQATYGTPITSIDQASPGDLIATPGSDGTLAQPGHVGLYLGEKLVISAMDTERGVTVQTYADFVSGGLSTIRHLG